MGKIRDLKPEDSEDKLAPLGVATEEETKRFFQLMAQSRQINGYKVRRPMISKRLEAAICNIMLGMAIGAVGMIVLFFIVKNL